VTRTPAGDDEPVLVERRDGGALDYDHRVILAIVDDLMFTSKIRTTARQLDVPLSIARSREDALADMHAHPPALVILDLNCARTDPMGIVAAMKADPTLAAIRTIGFSHHSQTDAIEAARRAGVGEVLARGTFFERLPDYMVQAKQRPA
jgi:PleD family two-component response regulator